MNITVINSIPVCIAFIFGARYASNTTKVILLLLRITTTSKLPLSKQLYQSHTQRYIGMMFSLIRSFSSFFMSSFYSHFVDGYFLGFFSFVVLL